MSSAVRLANYQWSPHNNGFAPYANWNALASSADGSHLIGALQGGDQNGNGIYTSSDGGATWTVQTNGLANTYRADWTSVACSADGSQVVAVIYQGDYNGNGIYTSTNGGTNWCVQTNGLAIAFRAGWNSVASSADGTHLAAVIWGGDRAGNGVYTSG